MDTGRVEIGPTTLATRSPSPAIVNAGKFCAANFQTLVRTWVGTRSTALRFRTRAVWFGQPLDIDW
jgi:hypothetical protein